MPQIRTLCRIKPTAEYYPEFEASRNTLYLRVPEVLRENWENNVRGKANVSHEFNFDYIFKNTATQEEVFEVAAKEIIQGRTIYSWMTHGLILLHNFLYIKRFLSIINTHSIYLRHKYIIAYSKSFLNCFVNFLKMIFI